MLLRESLDYLKSGGVLMVPIALANLAIWFCYLEGFLKLREAETLPTEQERRKAVDDTRWIPATLGVLVVATPLLGLLGTVIGMSSTFGALSSAARLSSHIADGIRLALVTTQAGLLAALPGTFALPHLAWLRRRATQPQSPL